MLISCHDANFQATLRQPRWMVVAFTGDWCPHCRQLMPELAQLANSSQDLDVVRADFAQCPVSTRQAGVQGVPALALVQGGPTPQLVRWLNARRAQDLRQEVEQLLLGPPLS